MLFPLLQRKLIRGCKEHVAAKLSCAADYISDVGTPIYAPCSGTIYHFQEKKGGLWIGIRRDDGMHFEFAHLSKRLLPQGKFCTVGDQIALSGNTGTETTNPHLHHQIIHNGGRIDPEVFYSPRNIPIVCINGSTTFLQEVQREILTHSQGMLTISWDIVKFPISIKEGMLTQDMAYNLSKSLYDPALLPFRYILLFYQGNATSTFLATFYNPAQENCLSTIPFHSSARLVAFEFAHQVQKFYNTHRGDLPYVEIEDNNYPTNDLIVRKFRSILPYDDILLIKK